MSKVLGFVGPENLCDKRLLQSSNDPDNSLEPWKFLLDRLDFSGFSLIHHKKISTSITPYGYIFMNYDDKNYRRIQKKAPDAKKYLIIFESEVVMPENWSPDIASKFDLIFSWDESLRLEPRERFVPFFWPNSMPRCIEPKPFKSRNKNFVMIASSKMKRHQLELYSERLYTIDWFIKNAPDKFDLYGRDWNYGVMDRVKKRIKNLFRVLVGESPFPVDLSSVYRGAVDSKIRVMSDYRFCFCYENARDIPGYVTEKIFDCFSAGVVPIYWGWSDVSKYIPEGCFIDRRNFKSMESLVEYLMDFTEADYNAYLSSIADFIGGSLSDKFRSTSFSEILASRIAN